MATLITIPYKPRYPKVHEAIEDHRFTVLVAHRRFGKTVLVINHLIRQALTCTKERGVFAYVAPLRNQAKNVAWDYLKHYTSVIPGRTVNESELWISLPSPAGTARVRLFGADNPDALRGMYFDSVVLDEVAQMKGEVWQEIIQPALIDRGGSAVFIGTPKGVNLFSELYNTAMNEHEAGNKDWLALSYPVTKTNVLPEKDVERLKRELSDNVFRQELMCDFSASSDDVLIPLMLVDGAQRKLSSIYQRDNSAPLILGVDVARFGDDASVLFFRQGLVAEEPIVIQHADNMALADRIATEMTERLPQAVFIDAGGGAGVIDRLRQLGHTVNEIPFGSRAIRADRYVNRRAEMWDSMKLWLEGGGCLPKSDMLRADLTTPTYSFDAGGKIKLESKESIKERLQRSPDMADALALTFAAPVASSARIRMEEIRRAKEYDPLAW